MNTDSETMLTFLIEGLADGEVPSPDLAVRLARAFPAVRALELTLALASAADGVGNMLAEGHRQAAALYRLGTLVAVDTLVLEVEGAAPSGQVMARHLLDHWRHDPFFAGTKA